MPKRSVGKKTGLAALLAAFGAAGAFVLSSIGDVEGGYVNHPSDPGGATNHGITERVARANGYRGHMRNLPKELANEIYFKQYVTKPNFDDVMGQRLEVGYEMIDTGVNAGQSRAAKWFQRSVNLFNRRGLDYPDLVVDGQIGPASLSAYKALERKRGKLVACQLVLRAMDTMQGAHYIRLAERSQKFEDFQVGWFRTRIRNISCVKDPQALLDRFVEGAQ